MPSREAHDLEGRIAQAACNYLTSGPLTLGEMRAYAAGMAASVGAELTPLPSVVSTGPRRLSPERVLALGTKAIAAIEGRQFAEARKLVADIAQHSPDLARSCTALLESLDVELSAEPPRAKRLTRKDLIGRTVGEMAELRAREGWFPTDGTGE